MLGLPAVCTSWADARVDGNGGVGSDPNSIYLTAGLLVEPHGLFPRISEAQEPASIAVLSLLGRLRRGTR